MKEGTFRSLQNIDKLKRRLNNRKGDHDHVIRKVDELEAAGVLASEGQIDSFETINDKT